MLIWYSLMQCEVYAMLHLPRPIQSLVPGEPIGHQLNWQECSSQECMLPMDVTLLQRVSLARVFHGPPRVTTPEQFYFALDVGWTSIRSMLLERANTHAINNFTNATTITGANHMTRATLTSITNIYLIMVLLTVVWVCWKTSCRC